MSVGVDITINGLAGALAMLEHLSGSGRAELMDGLARLGASQTQRRIQSEKTSPEGAAWPRTRDGRGALFATGAHLYQSIDHRSSDTTASWGTGWIGARVHQFGALIRPVNAKALAFRIGGKSAFAKSVTIPARPFIGVSSDNIEELRATAEAALARIAQ
jgi:phage gpG-like protein